MKFPFVRPELPPVEAWGPLLEPAYQARYFTNFGALETRFSEALAGRFASEGSAVTLANNATVALSAALLAHGVRGKVAIPSFTFPATLDAVLMARCEPVLCDVSADTCEMDPDSLSKAMDEHEIAAVMPVRAYGFVRDFAPLVELARSRSAVVVVDAAAALGAGKVQTAPDVTEVFSLHATKAFGIGEGGAIFSDAALRPRLKQAMNFGLRPDRQFDYGFNGKMSEFQAAVGLAHLSRNDALVEGRRRMADWYGRRLEAHPRVTVLANPGPTAWSNFPILLPDGADAQAFQDFCHGRGYQVRRYYWPTLHEGYAEPVLCVGGLDQASSLAKRAICLPLYPAFTDEEAAEIALVLDQALSLHAG